MNNLKSIYYGAAYYDEYMPCERLAEDIRLMKKAGINVVRIGESTWSTMEPQEGVFDFSHLDRVLDAMHEAGIAVILGTCTYAIPTWMVKSYPQVLAVTRQGEGHYGARQIMDITSPTYLFYAERAIRRMMEHCAGHPAVIGVQIDNETKAYGTAGPNVHQGFIKYVREKFDDDLDRMNAAYGLDYWSNRINAWEDFPDVRFTINASLGGEFARYQRKLVTDFLKWQYGVVREYLREDQFVTHNTDFNWIGYSWGLNGETDVYDNAQAMDVAGVDIYHKMQDDFTGLEIAFGGDLTRSLKQDNYLVLETEAQGHLTWLPYDGQTRLAAYSHIAGGADMVAYWHWHTTHNAFETYWKGILSQDFKENAVYQAVSTVGSELAALGDRITDLRKANKVAILVDNASLTALNYFPIDKGMGFPGMPGAMGYNHVLMEVYEALYKLGVECDFLWPQNAERMRDYDLLVVPALYAAEDALLGQIRDYVKAGGHVFATYKTGFSDENTKVYHDEAPHALSECLGVSYSLFTVPANVGLTGESDLIPEKTLAAARLSSFMEMLEIREDAADTLTVLARYDHPSWKRYVGAVHNRYGKGTATYLGCRTDAATLTAVLEVALRAAGVEGHIAKTPEGSEVPGVRIRIAQNTKGERLTFYFNYSPETVTVQAEEAGEILLGEESGKRVAAGAALAIEPWSLALVAG